jgi:hypothetical protein
MFPKVPERTGNRSRGLFRGIITLNQWDIIYEGTFSSIFNGWRFEDAWLD